jgi:cell wall-associated NlpC family hydrolase
MMSGTAKRFTRLAVAVVFIVPTIVVAAGHSSVAAPTKAEVDAAEAKANEIGHQLEIAIEAYNDARLRLQEIQGRLADALEAKESAEAEAAEAIALLTDRAVEAYTSAGSNMDVLLDATDLSEFSDRLEFMGALAQNDADIASAAENAQQQAVWAADRYRATIDEKSAELEQMQSKRADIQAMLDEQKALVDQLNAEYAAYIERQEAQAAAAEAAEQQAATDSGTGTPPGDPGTGVPPPPPNGSTASAAIAAAQSVLGAPYVWGSAGPSSFDCSGLTSWAYGQAGVYLPHSSAAQASYGSVVPSLAQAQPGDLLFFYSPISHVALYMGGGSMIHARHPGPGGQVQINSVSGYGTPVVRIVRPT